MPRPCGAVPNPDAAAALDQLDKHTYAHEPKPTAATSISTAGPANFDEAVIDAQLRKQEEFGWHRTHPLQYGRCRGRGAR